MTTKAKILAYLKDRSYWCSGTQLEDQSHEWGTKASTISRRCRELADEGAVERMIKGKTVQYRLKENLNFNRSTLPTFDQVMTSPQATQLFDLPKQRISND